MEAKKIFKKEDVKLFLQESRINGLITIAEENSFVFRNIESDLICINFGTYLANTATMGKRKLSLEQKQNVLNFYSLMKKQYENSNVKVLIRF